MPPAAFHSFIIDENFASTSVKNKKCFIVHTFRINFQLWRIFQRGWKILKSSLKFWISNFLVSMFNFDPLCLDLTLFDGWFCVSTPPLNNSIAFSNCSNFTSTNNSLKLVINCCYTKPQKHWWWTRRASSVWHLIYDAV